MIEYRSFLEELKPYVVKIQKEKIERTNNGELFNIFPILRKPHDEEYLHSAFLAELLNPKGNHGQGCVFLELFMETCCVEYSDLNVQNARVTVEHHAGPINVEMTKGGKIDLLIEFGQNAIVIENKIYAQDQENQLLRYANFAKDNYKNHKLLYLTLELSKPSKYSLGDVDVEYRCISYSGNILSWLKRCIEHSIDKPMINIVMQQYVVLLKTLTQQSIFDTMNKDILELIKSDDAYTRCVVELIQTGNSLESDVTNKFYDLLTARISGVIDLNDGNKIEVTQIEDSDGLCICIQLLNASENEITSLNEQARYSEIFKSLYPQKVNSNRAYIAWYNPKMLGNRSGFKDLSLYKKIEMALSEVKLNDLVDEITIEKDEIVTSFLNAVSKRI